MPAAEPRVAAPGSGGLRANDGRGELGAMMRLVLGMVNDAPPFSRSSRATLLSAGRRVARSVLPEEGLCVRGVQDRRGCEEWTARTSQGGRSEAMPAMAAGGEAEVATHGMEFQPMLWSLFPDAGGACSDDDRPEGVERREQKTGG
jgi:hypothetical protein